MAHRDPVGVEGRWRRGLVRVIGDDPTPRPLESCTQGVGHSRCGRRDLGGIHSGRRQANTVELLRELGHGCIAPNPHILDDAGHDGRNVSAGVLRCRKELTDVSTLPSKVESREHTPRLPSGSRHIAVSQPVERSLISG